MGSPRRQLPGRPHNKGLIPSARHYQLSCAGLQEHFSIVQLICPTAELMSDGVLSSLIVSVFSGWDNSAPSIFVRGRIMASQCKARKKRLRGWKLFSETNTRSCAESAAAAWLMYTWQDIEATAALSQ